MHLEKLCGAAAFDSTAFKCYFKTTNVTAVGAVPRDGWTLGIANRTQYQSLPVACTNNGKNETAQNGLAFTVYCNQQVAGLDSCPDESPDCRWHTSSLEECLDFCSKMHPLCTGVAWDPALHYGYMNCYPKNATAQVFDNTRNSNSEGIRAAKALLEVATENCLSSASSSSNGTMVASNNEIFKLSCEEDRPGNDLAVQHADSLEKCINSCATYTKTNCLGAVFDATMVNGYENCYLKSAIGGPTPDQNGFIFTMRQNTSNNSTSNDSTITSHQKHEKSIAWIAGPVISTIVAVTVILAALWWCRKRRGKKTQDAQEIGPEETWLPPELDPATMNSAKYY
jgi:hypothetical protein